MHLLPQPALAQDLPTLLLLRPHCEEEDPIHCADFAVADTVTLQTPTQKAGDTLDIDVIIRNLSKRSISRVSTWISYDPTILEGVSLDIDPSFPIPMPEENLFDDERGYAKIGVVARDGSEPSNSVLIVARIRFRVLTTKTDQTILSFYDLKPSTEGHTVVIEKTAGKEKNILPSVVPSVRVVLSDAEAQSSNSSFSSSSSDVSSSRTSFTLLQVQNVRITTEGSSILLGWDHLQSSELNGYNIYYGTQMGRYIQRKSIPGDQQSLIIRALPLEATYYVAIRAVSQSGEESAFSQEVAVTVGDPKTSTAPLLAGQRGGPQGKNPIKNTSTPSVPGESGPGMYLVLLLAGSAAMGTLLAFRRQMLAYALS